MKVQIYKENVVDGYEAILVDNGELYDSTYEVLLRTENKLTGNLPFFALPVGQIDKGLQVEIAKLIADISDKLRNKISEVIINEDKELTIILSLGGSPSSAFFGKLDWKDKLLKLNKIVLFMEEQKKIPAVINLINTEKVVVKFSDKF